MKLFPWFMSLLLLLFAGTAMAEEAADITRECAMSLNGQPLERRTKMTDAIIKTAFPVKAGDVIEICPDGGAASGLMLRFLGDAGALTVQLPNGEGWQDEFVFGDHVTQWYGFTENIDVFRLVNRSDRTLLLAEVNVYGPGEQPVCVHDWRETEKADLMIIVAHPDDELLWFGGALPEYAWSRDLSVRVVYATVEDDNRMLELLDGLWTCGVKDYPLFFNFPDKLTKDLNNAYFIWGGKEKIQRALVDVLRRYRPDVVATHARNGESGHAAHKLLSYEVPETVAMAADRDQYPEILTPWQVSKVYVHLWQGNQSHFDWLAPRSAFHGENSYEQTTRALACHASQTGIWNMQQGERERTNNTLFGLYFSTVGPDVIGGDFMENLPQLPQAE